MVHHVDNHLQDPPISVHTDQHVATVPEGGQDVGHEMLVPQPPPGLCVGGVKSMTLTVSLIKFPKSGMAETGHFVYYIEFLK